MANTKKLNGTTVLIRGSNQKYTELNDLDWLFEELKHTTRAELAKKLGVPYNSINYRVHKYFSEEKLKQIIVERRHY